MSIKLKKVNKVPRSRREFMSAYDAILNQFLKDETMTYALVTKAGVKPSSLLAALRDRISKNYEGELKAIQRGTEVYLMKKFDSKDRITKKKTE